MLEVPIEHLPFAGHAPLGRSLLLLRVYLVPRELVQLLLLLQDLALHRLGLLDLAVQLLHLALLQAVGLLQLL